MAEKERFIARLNAGRPARYDDADGSARQVIDHRFRAVDGSLYAIRSSGPEDLAADLVRAPLTTPVASFCPSGARCG
ncbi:hypothetical protein [Streptomyces adustus]|uniref:hypothetical protein n=1 Tax=Streptomyces adustus TaxID=1609272 RepID=UPI00192E5850|nr:hypothetical protein [Streptomyces adustus]